MSVHRAVLVRHRVDAQHVCFAHPPSSAYVIIIGIRQSTVSAVVSDIRWVL
jgi:hypothetical protein